MKYALEPDEPVADGLVRVIRGQVRKLRRLAETSGEDPREFVRSARVASKRIRAALKLARPMMSGKANREIRNWWRDQARALSETRDLAARVEAMGALESGLAEAAGGRLATGLRSRFERDLVRSEKGDSALDPVTAFRKALADAPGPDPHAMKDAGFADLLKAYSTGYRKARHAMLDAVESGDIELYHEWRKSAKAHALHTRLLRRLSPVLEARVAETRDLAERLGELQDIAVSRTGLEAMPSPPGGQAGLLKLGAALEARQAEVIRDARRIGRRLFAERPRDFVRALSSEAASPQATDKEPAPVREMEDAD